MKIVLDITKSSGKFHPDPKTSTHTSVKTSEVFEINSKSELNSLMAGFFDDWTGNELTDSGYERIVVGCSNVYKNDSLFISVRRENCEIVRAEHMARAYINEGRAILMGRPDRFKIGESPARYPQIIVTGIVGKQDFHDFDDDYYNTVVSVSANPEYVWTYF